VLLDPREYQGMRDYYQKIAANDQQQVVLTSGGTATGN
jgi:molybdopterin biosynthesis enzyme MoaB